LSGFLTLPGLLALGLLQQACTSIPVEQRPDKRAEINRVADETLAQMTAENPGLREAVNRSAGYFVSRVSAANVAVLGGGQGIGVLVDQETGERSYLNVKRFDLGAGLGVRYYRVLLLIETREKMEKVRRGISFRALAADVAAGAAGGATIAGLREGVTVHVQAEGGGSISASARLVRLTVNRDLTDTGLSEIGIPNIGFGIEDGRAQTERRWWDHKMPFMAQKVVDMGYDLPLPYGLRVSYVNVDQDQLLDNLWVGFNGSEKAYLDWVEFTNAQSVNDTVQGIFDVWVLPFMNVFGVLGKIDGHAPVDVVIDGNGFLGQLGIDCSKPGNVVICNVLQDKQFLLPIDAQFEGNNYGIGVTLAGGWNGYFVTLPITYVYADMEGSNTDGAVISASPRFGKVYNLGSKGNLAFYLGGSYLDSDLTVDGSVTVPGTEFTIDYTIDQKNKDKWTAVLGANWDISNRWSIQGEYNGFTGSRESWMGSVTWRF
jgi:hypothetical protein